MKLANDQTRATTKENPTTMNPIAREAIDALRNGKSINLRDLPRKARKDFAEWFDALPKNMRWQSCRPTSGFVGCCDHPLFAAHNLPSVDVPFLDWYIACRNRPSGKHVFGDSPAPEKPSLDLVLLRDIDETKRFENAMEKAGWTIPGRGVPPSRGARDPHFPVLAILHEATRTYDWWKLGATDPTDRAKFSDSRCETLGMASLGVFGAHAAIEASAKPPKTERIDAEWLKANDACAEGREWFDETFGPRASVEREALEATLKAAGMNGWLAWLSLH